MSNKTFVTERCDKYFTKSRKIAELFGDCTVEYGVFQRRAVVAAPRLAVSLINEYCPEAEVIEHVEEGAVVPPKTKTLTIKGPFSKLVELETLWLQKLGFAQTCAYNAYKMSIILPHIQFLDMHGRHATGDDMVEAAAYGASVGSRSARLQGAKGFIGTSNDLTAHYYTIKHGLGTMPHAIVGYAGLALRDEYETNIENIYHPCRRWHNPEEYAEACGTLKSMQMYLEANPDDRLIIVLVDYFGHEVSDSIMCADYFFNKLKLHEKGYTFGVRLDTNGERFLENLDWDKSVELVSRWVGVYPTDEYACVRKVIGDEVFDAAANTYLDEVRRILFGKGVSVANLISMRKSLNNKGFNQAKIIASSGFDLFKCQLMAKARAPIDIVGTGSFLPKTLSETYATADIYSYNGINTVKVGREWLQE